MNIGLISHLKPRPPDLQGREEEGKIVSNNPIT